VPNPLKEGASRPISAVREENSMACRPFTFGVRLRDKDRTVKIRQDSRKQGFVVEDSRGGRSRKRSHASLGGAISDAASTWRGRLH
jgi:hypothetical protein